MEDYAVSLCAHRMPRLRGRLNTSARTLDSRPPPIVAAVLVAAALLLIWKVRFVLLLLFAGSIGSLLLSELATRLQRCLKIRRGLAFGTVLLSLGTTAGVAGWLRGSAILHQIQELQLDVPAAAHRIAALVGSSEWGRWIAAQVLDPEQLSKGIGIALTGLGGAITTTASILGGAFIIGFVAIYLAAEPDIYRRGLFGAAPKAFRQTLQACIDRAIHNLRYWILAKIVSMSVIGAIVTAGLWGLGVPLAATLGTLAGLMTFIPNVGPLLSVVPAALLAFASSPTKGMMTILLFALAHVIEGNLVTPLLERKIVKLPPVLTLTNQLLLATLTGFAGIALAAPLTAAILGIAQVMLPAEESSDAQTSREKCPQVVVQV